jgi:GSH-dependent disulfide-bond oxidoreductase
VTIALEEMGVAYDATFVGIMQGKQFGDEFTQLNPNQKIPVLLDTEGPSGDGTGPHAVMESGAILLYLAEKTKSELLPVDPVARSTCLQWLFWNIGTAPYLGQYGHFAKYAKEKLPYAIDRYAMESKRIVDVLDRQLAKNRYVAGETYTIADIAIYPWIICLDKYYAGREVLGLDEYKNVERWVEEVSARPAVKMGMKINGFSDVEFQNYSSDGKMK